MTKEQYVKQLIQSNGLSVKGFAEKIDIPYTTLLSMLKNGLGGASVDNVIKVCKGLNIAVEDLEDVVNSEIFSPFHTTEHEKELVMQYRCKPDLQRAVDILLGVDE